MPTWSRPLVLSGNRGPSARLRVTHGPKHGPAAAAIAASARRRLNVLVLIWRTRASWRDIIRRFNKNDEASLAERDGRIRGELAVILEVNLVLGAVGTPALAGQDFAVGRQRVTVSIDANEAVLDYGFRFVE